MPQITRCAAKLANKTANAFILRRKICYYLQSQKQSKQKKIAIAAGRSKQAYSLLTWKLNIKQKNNLQVLTH